MEGSWNVCRVLVLVYLVNYVQGQVIRENILQVLQQTTGFSKVNLSSYLTWDLCGSRCAILFSKCGNGVTNSIKVCVQIKIQLFCILMILESTFKRYENNKILNI